MWCQFRRRESHNQSRNDGGNKNSGAGRREPVEFKSSVLGFRWIVRGGFWDDGRDSNDNVVQSRNLKGRCGELIQGRFNEGNTPNEYQQAKENPWGPCRANFRGIMNGLGNC